MRKVIWKYPIPQSAANVYGAFVLDLPRPFRVVDVAVDELGPALWIQHDKPGPAHPAGPIEFHIVGTGHEHANDLVYQGTYRVGSFVWHIMVSRGLLL